MVIMQLQRNQKPAMAILVTVREDYVFSVKHGGPGNRASMSEYNNCISL